MLNLYRLSIFFILGCAVLVFIILFFISAPYGKFSRKGWGSAIKSKWAWMIMELPSPALMLIFFITSANKDLPEVIFLLIWLFHYMLRTFIYPFRQSGKDKPFPVVVLSMAFLFNCFNGFINGYGVFHLYRYTTPWLTSWQFITGLILFITGMVINKTADEKLRMLRQNNPSGYMIPRGWFFTYISCPHYFGEIIEWGGWAIMTWSLPGFTFFIFTFANLFPRAVMSHRWYKIHFSDYPPERKAIIPLII